MSLSTLSTTHDVKIEVLRASWIESVDQTAKKDAFFVCDYRFLELFSIPFFFFDTLILYIYCSEVMPFANFKTKNYETKLNIVLICHALVPHMRAL